MLEILFDKRDHELLSIVNEVCDPNEKLKYLKKLLDPYLHPHGIKEMAAPQGLRIAYAVLNLLDSLDVGMARDRINALISLKGEILNLTRSPLRHNTGRVLLQIMKEMVRGDQERYVLNVLQEFNSKHRLEVSETYGVDLEPLEQSEFIAFVGSG